MKNSGRIVKTKDGKIGRTFDNKQFIDGKVPVYLCAEYKHDTAIPLKYSDKAILCRPETLKVIGYID